MKWKKVKSTLNFSACPFHLYLFRIVSDCLRYAISHAGCALHIFSYWVFNMPLSSAWYFLFHSWVNWGGETGISTQAVDSEPAVSCFVVLTPACPVTGDTVWSRCPNTSTCGVRNWQVSGRWDWFSWVFTKCWDTLWIGLLKLGHLSRSISHGLDFGWCSSMVSGFLF